MNCLMVPLLVEVLLQGRADSEDGRFPVAAPDYSEVLTNSYLGSLNTPGPFELSSAPLPCGAHLHFVVPDAFTRSDEKGVYPPAPNRYVVTRLAVSPDDTIALRRFIIESDFISRADAYDGNATIPAFEDDTSDERFCYLGRCRAEGEAFNDDGVFLDKLTVIGPGDPAFAAYYPNCGSVFGFYDDMAGVPDGSGISYFVVGYFSDVSADPLNGVSDEESFAAALGGLKFSVADTGRIRSRTLVFGEAAGIVWQGGEHYYGKGIPEGEIDVSLGNTSAEALAKMISHKLGGNENDERYLTALQYSLLDGGHEIDANFKIDDEIHARGFAVVAADAGGVELAVEKDAGEFHGGGDFSALTKKKEAYAGAAAELAAERRKLFYLWEQYMYLYEHESSYKAYKGRKIPSKDRVRAEIRAVAESVKRRAGYVAELGKEADAMTDSFLRGAPPGVTLKESGGEPYYRPKAPALLLSGSGLNRSFAFGEDGRHTDDGTLLCLTDTVDSTADKEKLLALFGDLSLAGTPSPLADDYGELLCQAAVLSPSVKARAEKTLGAIKVGRDFSPIMLNLSPQNFTTLFMDWSVRFYPTRASAQGAPDDTLSGWGYEYGDTAYTYEGKRPAERNIIYTGRSVVTPHATYGLREMLTKWIDAHSGDEASRRAAGQIHELPILSQNLGGLTEQLSALSQSLQFPIIGNPGDEELAALVRDYSGTDRVSCSPSEGLFSLRGGYFRMERLNLISTFGRVQQVIKPAQHESDIKEIFYAETIASNDRNYGLLTPGFLAPMRLSFAWRSCADKDLISSPDPATTPVCAFILPEMLNRRLLVYDNGGDYRGTLKTIYRSGKPRAAWVGAPGFETYGDAVDIDATLKAFLSSMNDDAFNGLMDLIDGNCSKTLPSASADVVYGRPLALARACVRLMSLGGFPFNMDYGAFGAYDTQGLGDVRVPLHFGDIRRVSDGTVAIFPDAATDGAGPGPSFDRIYPAWGISGPENAAVSFDTCPDIAYADGERFFTVLMEVGHGLNIQTGILPVKTVYLPAEHAKVVGDLTMAAELTSVLTPKGEVQLPIMSGGKPSRYSWRCFDEEGKEVVQEVKPPLPAYGESLICDGMLLLKS